MGEMEWSPVRRVAFRFWLVFAALLIYPFPLGTIPKTEGLNEILSEPFSWGISWLATAVLGLDDPPMTATGSGDTMAVYLSHLLVAILAAIGAAIWTALDRRRTSYRHLADAALVVLRYYLAAMLLVYAVAKLTQFPPPTPARLDERVGDMSPMGVLWTFMGASRPYALFTGIVEGCAGALLLWRRTQAVGALLGMAAMGNVVALNFCYDVPVKLLSTQLFVLSAVVFAPHARRVIGALLGRAAPEVPPRPRRSLRAERARLAAKLLFLVGVGLQLAIQIEHASDWIPPPTELHGAWIVDRMSVGGVERPPLLTDAERWHKVLIWQNGLAVRPMDGLPERHLLKLDRAEHQIELDLGPRREVWRYTLAAPPGAPAALVLEGTYRGKPFRAELHREPAPLLVTRGFHWIQEAPFNR